ncbi:amidohydrolase family protein, partial [Acinetobacter baumannii]
MHQGKIVDAPVDGVAARTIDACGMVVMPGGIDLHSHIVGGKVNAARRLRPESARNADPVLRTH